MTQNNIQILAQSNGVGDMAWLILYSSTKKNKIMIILRYSQSQKPHFAQVYRLLIEIASLKY